MKIDLLKIIDEHACS